ncbi:MAG: thiol reductant ABC exporter subunit CydD [Cypionkella sp.]
MAGRTVSAEEQVLVLLMQPVQKELRLASALSAFSAMIWLIQAGFAAHGLAGMLKHGGDAWFSVGGFTLAGILRALATYWSESLSFTASTRVVVETRARIVRREALATDGLGAGFVAALAGEKLDLLLPYITRYAPAQARVRVVPLAILAVAFWYSWAVGVVFLITGPLIPVFMALVGMAAKEASQRQMTEIGTLNDLLVERLSALIDIRLLGATEAVAVGFADGAERLRAQTMAVLRVAFLSSTVLELFSAIGVAMVAVYVGFDLLGLLGFGSYGGQLSPAVGIYLLLLAPDFYQPLRDLSAAWHDQSSALAVAGELAAWQATEAPMLLGTGSVAARLSGPATVAVHSVVVRSGDRLIRYPDFAIAPGERVALMGASGAGKTSLLRLLAGMLVPDQGSITVAGRELVDEVADSWRARLGWMPQAPQFLSDSLEYNLTFGRDGDVTSALHLAAAEDVVAGLPSGLATRLGETGGGLSGGQARRLTLARAIYAAPDVLLADEPTADLDAATAQKVVAGLMALADTGCTLIVATHDAGLAARMDRVIRI